jgi:hypothetical protein
MMVKRRIPPPPPRSLYNFKPLLHKDNITRWQRATTHDSHTRYAYCPSASGGGFHVTPGYRQCRVGVPKQRCFVENKNRCSGEAKWSREK